MLGERRRAADDILSAPADLPRRETPPAQGRRRDRSGRIATVSVTSRAACLLVVLFKVGGISRWMTNRTSGLSMPMPNAFVAAMTCRVPAMKLACTASRWCLGADHGSSPRQCPIARNQDGSFLRFMRCSGVDDAGTLHQIAQRFRQDPSGAVRRTNAGGPSCADALLRPSALQRKDSVGQCRAQPRSDLHRESLVISRRTHSVAVAVSARIVGRPSCSIAVAEVQHTQPGSCVPTRRCCGPRRRRTVRRAHAEARRQSGVFEPLGSTEKKLCLARRRPGERQRIVLRVRLRALQRCRADAVLGKRAELVAHERSKGETTSVSPGST